MRSVLPLPKSSAMPRISSTSTRPLVPSPRSAGSTTSSAPATPSPRRSAARSPTTKLVAEIADVEAQAVARVSADQALIPAGWAFDPDSTAVDIVSAVAAEGGLEVETTTRGTRIAVIDTDDILSADRRARSRGGGRCPVVDRHGDRRALAVLGRAPCPTETGVSRSRCRSDDARRRARPRRAAHRRRGRRQRDANGLCPDRVANPELRRRSGAGRASRWQTRGPSC